MNGFINLNGGAENSCPTLDKIQLKLRQRQKKMENNETTLESPQLEIISGNPNAEELAAVTAVVLSLTRPRPNPHAPESSTIAGGWKSYWHTIRHAFIPGRDAWRSTFRR